MTRLPDGATQIWVDAVRIAQLDSEGFIDPGAPVYVTDKVIKATATPVLETGDDIALKNAAGDLAVFGKHGDFPRYYTMAVELGAPDAILEQLTCGGVLLGAENVAVVTPTGLTVTPLETGGSIAKGIVAYRVTAYNVYGETAGSAEVTAEVKGEGTGSAVIGGVTIPTGALGVRVYGRTQGQEQFIGAYKSIGKQKTTGEIEGEPTTVAVEPLTTAIPAGTQFTVSGDTNSPKVVFKTTAYAAVNSTSVPVEKVKVTTKIKAGELLPVLVDDGSKTPEGHVPNSDSTVGPGASTGYQAPKLGKVPQAAKNGFSIEFWGEAIIDGAQAGDVPFYWWVFPRIKDAHVQPREFANAPNLLTIEGQAYGNPNWGKGPTKEWPVDSTKVFQRIRCGRQVTPSPSLENVPAV